MSEGEPPEVRILVVEDDPDDFLLLRRELERLEGPVAVHRVTTREELEASLREPWDLVLTDYALGTLEGMDGLEVFRRVREGGPGIPVVLVSGYLEVRDAVAAMREGIDNFVLKDELENLLPVIRRELRESRERRAAAASLHESQERLRSFFKSHAVGMAILDLAGSFVEANDALCELVDRPLEDLRARTLREVLHEEEGSTARRALTARDTPSGRPAPVELRFLRPDGEVVWGRTSWSWLRDPAGEPIALGLVVQDTTASRLLADRLEASQHLEAVGQLSGGIAHDFNNLLGIIAGQAELMEGELPEGDPLREDLELILSTCERAGALVRKLLLFSRKQPLAPRLLDLGSLVEDLTAMLERLLGEDVHLEIDVDEACRAGGAMVLADPSSLEQVLMNLAVNARDAMPQGGALHLGLGQRELDAEFVREHPGASPGPHVLLEVRDTGHGMSPTVTRRVFEPFYTTKEPGAGTGLGLSTVYGIVRKSRGVITLYSEEGLGTTVRVYLPRADGQAAGEAPRRRARPSAETDARPGETILLVEDEEDLRYVMRRYLERAGYDVLEASGPDEAEELAAGAERLDLLLTDVVMPERDGRELAARIAVERPELPVVFMSGYSRAGMVSRGLMDEWTAFLQKPVPRETLLREVRRVLDADPVVRPEVGEPPDG